MGSTSRDTVASEGVTPGRATSMRPGVWVTDVSLVLMATVWGVNFSVVKFGTSIVDPLAYNGVRLMIAAVLLVGIAGVMRVPLPSKRTTLGLLALGLLGNGIYQFFFVEGIARTSASDTALVFAASPAFIAIIGRLRGVDRLSGKGTVGVALSVVGLVFVVVGSTQDGGGQSSFVGDLLVLCCSLAWAVYTVLLKPYTERVDGMQLGAITMVGGAVPLFVVAWPAISATHWVGVSAIGWAGLLYSGVLSLAVAYYFWYRGIRVIGPTRAAMYSNLQPVIAVLVAWIVLGETPTVWQGLGTAGIMTGLVMTRN